MKTFATILLLAAGIFLTSSAQTTNSLRVSSGSLEIVLNLQKAFVRGTSTDYNGVVAFSAATNTTMEVTFRNVGEVSLERPHLLFGLSVILDGNEYKGQGLGYAGAGNFYPKTAWLVRLDLSHYIPPEALVSGRHTVAVKDAGVESNIQTIFIDAHK